MQTNLLRVLTGKDASTTFQRRMMHPVWMPTGFGIRSPDRSADKAMMHSLSMVLRIMV